MIKPTFFNGRLLVQVLFAVLLSTSMVACELLGDSDASTCEYEAARSVALSAADLDSVQVLSGPGSLEVVGRSGLDAIRVHGRACASSSDLLRQTELAASPEDGMARIETVIPQRALLDLVIEVPEGLAHRVDDSSGDAIFRNVASLDIKDGSGDLSIEGIAGDLYIDDGSGSFDVAGVGGTVSVVDGSNDLQIVDVQRDVLISSDGSGDIIVTDVGGDLLIDADDSGSIHYERIEVNVRLP